MLADRDDRRPGAHGRGRLWCYLIVVAVFASACGTSITVDTGTDVDPSLAAAGETVYRQYCASCHGADLRGTDQGPSHLSAVYAPNHHADGAFSLAIARGAPQHHWNFGPMPPVEGLTEADIAAIIAYVRTRQAEEGFEPYPP